MQSNKKVFIISISICLCSIVGIVLSDIFKSKADLDILQSISISFLGASVLSCTLSFINFRQRKFEYERDFLEYFMDSFALIQNLATWYKYKGVNISYDINQEGIDEIIIDNSKKISEFYNRVKAITSSKFSKMYRIADDYIDHIIPCNINNKDNTKSCIKEMVKSLEQFDYRANFDIYTVVTKYECREIDEKTLYNETYTYFRELVSVDNLCKLQTLESKYRVKTNISNKITKVYGKDKD